jgi:hypothetical protein
MNDALRKSPPPLPSTTADLLASRKINAERTLNDHVEDLHVQLWEDAKYKRLLYAVYDEQAVEGSLSADNILAAMRIRAEAINRFGKDSIVATEKLATISKSLGVVLRRYNQSRKERRNTVGGETVPAEANGE